MYDLQDSILNSQNEIDLSYICSPDWYVSSLSISIVKNAGDMNLYYAS